MARITTNTNGTQPVIVITTSLSTNGINPLVPSWTASGNAGGAVGNLTIPFVQDVTVTNSTGVYAYTTFSDVDTRKLSTPADNEISFNVVVDDTAWFGDAGGTASADDQGLEALSSSKTPIGFRIYYQGNTGAYKEGSGFITSLAPTTSPEAPVWVTPMTIAVDGAYTNGTQA